MPTFKGKLKPFQQEGLSFAIKNPYHINNFQAGLGKTITSLALACHSGGKILVICPAFLKNNWKKEIAKFTEGLDVTITSYASLKKIEDFNTFSTVIADEVHAVKNRDALRTKLLHDSLSVNLPKYFMGLTGTPVSNRVSEFWSLLQLCFYGGSYPEFKPYHRLYFKFCHRFSYERSFEVNGFPITRFDGLRKTRIKELQELIKAVLIRRRADDVLDLPGEVETDFVGTSKKYDEQLREALDLFKADPNDPQYMSLKAANALAKVDTTLKLARDLIEQGYRPLIFTCHRASAELLAEKLKCSKIDGNVNADKRQGIVDEFNSGGPSALVATIKSTAVGFNITSTNYTIFNDIDFSPDNIEQAKKRTLRMGQDKTCFYYYIFTSEFDQSLRDMVERKDKDINTLFKGFQND
jgi:SWI/SNF-related matrix-associated actin-dependent regulator 1 of chromatin subfamily A